MKHILIGTKFITSLILAMCLFLGACKNMSKSQKGTYIGAGAGAAAGAAIGKAAGNTAMGAILGAAVGGAAGYGIGRYMDKQAEELEKDLEGAEIERVGEGIKITFREGIQFALNSSELSETSKTNLTELAETLKKYDDTNILIEGHTDVSAFLGFVHILTGTQKQAHCHYEACNEFGSNQNVFHNFLFFTFSEKSFRLRTS